MSGNNFNQSGQKPPANIYNFDNVQRVTFELKKAPIAPGGPGPSRAGNKPLPTGQRQSVGEARPMTSNRGANFGQPANPMNQTRTQIQKPQLEKNPDEQFKLLEREINSLIEASAMAKLRGNLSESLEKAKEAFNKEKKLRQQKEAQNQ